MKLIWIICNQVWNLVGKHDFKFDGKFQIQKFETDFQRRLITPSLKIYFQRWLHCHNHPWKTFSGTVTLQQPPLVMHFQGRFMYWNRPWKSIFRGGLPTATAPENTIFRGGDPNGTAPRNAFSGAVKSPLLETPHLYNRWHCSDCANRPWKPILPASKDVFCSSLSIPTTETQNVFL